VTSLIAQKLVEPDAIESELKTIWEKLSQENKTRACLFNLLVFNRYSARTDYIRSIAQKVVEKFPCRLLFISEDPDADKAYLKTAVSVIVPQSKESSVACDHIDIGVGGSDIERTPYLVLPHILPDLPTTLLWTEDPAVPHPLFKPLTKLAHRVIFDSESATNLIAFAKTVSTLKKEGTFDVADLNWARTEEWRDLLAFLFRTPEKIDRLASLQKLSLVYNQKENAYFSHLQIQSMYLIGWLASRLGWQCNEGFQCTSKRGRVTLSIDSEPWENLGPGTVISIRLETKDRNLFNCHRKKQEPHCVDIQVTTDEKCDLPYQFLLQQTATGHSLVQEICRKGTSDHYLDMLQTLIHSEGLCKKV
jgi:glucose-6-phosphate dehydrogenase assembly protein OpcA